MFLGLHQNNFSLVSSQPKGVLSPENRILVDHHFENHPRPYGNGLQQKLCSRFAFLKVEDSLINFFLLEEHFLRRLKDISSVVFFRKFAFTLRLTDRPHLNLSRPFSFGTVFWQPLQDLLVFVFDLHCHFSLPSRLHILLLLFVATRRIVFSGEVVSCLYLLQRRFLLFFQIFT